MRLVAIVELVIFARVLFGAILLRNSLMMPIIYGNFLRQRYFHSAFTRDAIALADKRITDLSGHSSLPPAVGQVWLRVRELVARWGGSAVVEPAAARRD
jgi:transmembrane protein 33